MLFGRLGARGTRIMGFAAGSQMRLNAASTLSAILNGHELLGRGYHNYAAEEQAELWAGKDVQDKMDELRRKTVVEFDPNSISAKPWLLTGEAPWFKVKEDTHKSDWGRLPSGDTIPSELPKGTDVTKLIRFPSICTEMEFRSYLLLKRKPDPSVEKDLNKFIEGMAKLLSEFTDDEITGILAANKHSETRFPNWNSPQGLRYYFKNYKLMEVNTRAALFEHFSSAWGKSIGNIGQDYNKEFEKAHPKLTERLTILKTKYRKNLVDYLRALPQYRQITAKYGEDCLNTGNLQEILFNDAMAQIGSNTLVKVFACLHKHGGTSSLSYNSLVEAEFNTDHEAIKALDSLAVIAEYGPSGTYNNCTNGLFIIAEETGCGKEIMEELFKFAKVGGDPTKAEPSRFSKLACLGWVSNFLMSAFHGSVECTQAYLELINFLHKQSSSALDPLATEKLSSKILVHAAHYSEKELLEYIAKIRSACSEASHRAALLKGTAELDQDPANRKSGLLQ